MGRAAMRIVLAGFVQAEGAVHGEADYVGVAVLLAVVLPPADRAQRQGAGRLQRFVSTARTAKLNVHSFPFRMDENRGLRVYVKE